MCWENSGYLLSDLFDKKFRESKVFAKEGTKELISRFFWREGISRFFTLWEWLFVISTICQCKNISWNQFTITVLISRKIIVLCMNQIDVCLSVFFFLHEWIHYENSVESIHRPLVTTNKLRFLISRNIFQIWVNSFLKQNEKDKKFYVRLSWDCYNFLHHFFIIHQLRTNFGEKNLNGKPKTNIRYK